MYKLILILVVALVSYSNVNANSVETKKPTEVEELCQWEYWNAFSQTFNETADFWEAESAGLEAEKEAKDKTEAEEWLKKHQQERKQECL